MSATVPASRNGWRAWVYVKPQIPDKRSNRGFPLPINDDSPVSFCLRRVELSEWHLDDRWAWDMDIAIRERPIIDEIAESANEIEMENQLIAWSCDPTSLKLPDQVDYPYPPRMTSGRM